VRYGPVEIGESTYICPLRSLALSLAVPSPQDATDDRPTEWLNVTQFSNYHRFASTTRILADTPDARPVNPARASEPPQAVPSQIGEQATTVAKATIEETGPPSLAPISVPSPPSPLEASIPSAVQSTTSAQPLSAAQLVKEPQSIVPSIKLNVNRLVLPVVVRDLQGHSVRDLKKSDFQVFDNDRPRTVSAFTIEERDSSLSQGGARIASAGAPNDVGAAAPQNPALPKRMIVFLFDDMHLSFEDMAHAKKASLSSLENALESSELLAVVSMSGKTNTGLTHDRRKLQDAIIGLQPRLLSQADGADCPKIDYYQADLIVNKRDHTALQDAMDQVMLICTKGTPPDMAQGIAEGSARRILNVGDQDLQASYATLGELVHRMANLPGQRTLVLVSTGFISLEPGARTAESRVIDLAAQSNVTISALDARGLYTGTITASDDTRGRSPDLVADYRRTSMRLSEDTLGELSEGTGGGFFHNSNDLDAGFNGLIEAPELVYILELSLYGVPADGSYHRLKVKLDRDHVDLQARRGYFIPKPPKSPN